MSNILPVGQRTYVVDTATATTPDVAINCQGSGIAWHQLTWTVKGTVSACTVGLQQSADNATWTDLIAAQDASSSGQSSVENVVANYIRINPTSFTGTGSVTVVWNGYDQDPAGGGGGGIGGSIAATQVAFGVSSDTIGGTADFVYDSSSGAVSTNKPGTGGDTYVELVPGATGGPSIGMGDPTIGFFNLSYDDTNGYVIAGPAPLYIEHPVGVPAIVEVQISAAEIATWNSAPIQLLAAPGVGKFIDVTAVTLSYTAGKLTGSNIASGTDDLSIASHIGNPFALGSSGALDGGIGVIVYPYPNAQNNYQKLAVPTGTNDAILEVPYPSYITANRPLLFTGGSDADGTGGIGTSTLGSGGLLYAVGDAFTVFDADGDAFGYVDTVDGVTGAVLTYHLVNVGDSLTSGSLPDTSATTALSGSITAATVTSGNAGTGYAVGDLFLVTTGDGFAWCEVDTIGAGGSVATFHIVWGGSTYSTGTGNTTQVLSGFGDGSLEIDIGTVQNSSGSGLTIVITSLYLPDGTIKAIVTYTIQSL